MTPHEMQSLLQRALDAWNERDLDIFVNCYSDALTVYEGEDPESFTVSRDQHREAALAWWQRFPDLVETPREMMVEDGRLFLRTVSTGTLQRSWSGIEPTGRRVEWGAWYVYRIEDGLIVEERMMMDLMGLFVQLGAVEMPGG